MSSLYRVHSLSFRSWGVSSASSDPVARFLDPMDSLRVEGQEVEGSDLRPDQPEDEKNNLSIIFMMA